jgi:hypothetical protein
VVEGTSAKASSELHLTDQGRPSNGLTPAS